MFRPIFFFFPFSGFWIFFKPAVKNFEFGRSGGPIFLEADPPEAADPAGLDKLWIGSCNGSAWNGTS